MKLNFRFLATILASFAAPAVLPAQSPLPPAETVLVGGLATQAGGQAWAYLFWQTDALDLLHARSYSIWQKAGDAAAAGAFARVGIVKPQSDPASVGAVIDRARLALGENSAQLDTVVSTLFEDLMPTLTDVPAPQRLATKLAAVLRGVAVDTRKVQSLLLAAKYQPSIAMAAGQAYAAKIPLSGPVTFEVREYISETQSDAAVVGRVTVDNAAPVMLPVPSVVGKVPDLAQQGFNNLNIKLVWDTPDTLRRVLPLTQGANIYRVKRSIAEDPARHWQTTPPNSELLAAMAPNPASGVGLVNRFPIFAKKLLSAAEVGTAQPGAEFAIDDVLHMPGYPDVAARPKNGDQYYYFLTTRDVLGRENKGAASPGLLATFCDRVMPDTPEGVKVSNEYSFLNGVQHQNLKITWKANDNSGEKKTTSYVVYRWAKTDGPLEQVGIPPQAISLDPMAHLIAGPIPHIANQPTFSYLDTGAGAPSVPADLNQTFWYTVRAIDNSVVQRPPGGPFCSASVFGGNLSANSPAAYGTLRNRVGPDAPTGTVRILCPVPGIVAGTVSRLTDNSLDPTQRFVDLTATRPPAEDNIAAVDFDRQTGATWTPMGRVHFNPGSGTLVKHLVFTAGSLGSPIVIRARTVTATGEASPYASLSFNEPPALSLLTPYWACSVLYTRTSLSSLAGLPRCPAHAPPGPGTGVNPPGGNGIVVDFTPPAGTRQYKLYFRIDSAPLVLIKESSENFPPNVLKTIIADIPHAASSEVCLFLQVFDVDGNPSPMSPLGCFPLKGAAPLPKPMLAPVASSGTEASPAGLLNWFCPPTGIEKFEVCISSSVAPLPASLGVKLNQSTATPEGTWMEKTADGVFANFTYQVYNTERVGPLFGNGSTFVLSFPVVSGQKLRVKVRAVSEAGDAGPFSNIETFEWALPPAFTGPDVPWPTRSLPAMGGAGQFSGPMAAEYLPNRGFVGVNIGSVLATSHTVPHTFNPGPQTRQVTQIKSPEVPMGFLYTAAFTNPDVTRHMFPCILYRTQVADEPNPPSKPMADYPTVPGDIVQVSPLMESIAFATEPYSSGGTGNTIYDPFIHVESILGASATLNKLYLKDTTPVISHARYVYLLVLLDKDTKEIARVVPLPAIDIP